MNLSSPVKPQHPLEQHEMLLPFFIGLMPALVLIVPHGGNFAAIPLLLYAIFFHITVKKAELPPQAPFDKKEKILLLAATTIVLVVALDVVLRDLSLRYLDYYLRFILMIPIYLMLRKVKVNLKGLIIGSAIGAIGAGGIALWQMNYLDIHAEGFVMTINFGNISLLLGCMSLAGLLLAKTIHTNKIIIALCVFAFMCGVEGSLLSGSRGGWIALSFIIPLFFISIINKKYKIMSLFILIGLSVVSYQVSDSIKNRVNNVYVNTSDYYQNKGGQGSALSSSGTRLELWASVFLIAQENPFLGIGAGNYEAALKSQMAAGDIQEMDLYGHPHNEALTILVSMGLVGLLAYLILYFGAAYYFYSVRSSRNIEIRYLSLLGLLVVGCFFIFGLTNYSFGHQIMVLFFAVMVTVLAGMIKRIELDDLADGV